MVPISANLRYWVPPLPEHWRRLDKTSKPQPNGGDETLSSTPRPGDNVGRRGGTPAPSDATTPFCAGASREDGLRLDVRVVAGHPPQESGMEPGTFFEVAQQGKAGEDYADGGERAWSP